MTQNPVSLADPDIENHEKEQLTPLRGLPQRGTGESESPQVK
jgi:hypothetical protein